MYGPFQSILPSNVYGATSVLSLLPVPRADTLNGRKSMKDLMYFLGAAELLFVEILMLISHFPREASISVRCRRLRFSQLLVLTTLATPTGAAFQGISPLVMRPLNPA